MAVHVALNHTGKYSFGTVEVDGVDISNRVTSFAFERTRDGASMLTLHLAIHGEDTIDLGDIPSDNVHVHEHVYSRGKDPVAA